MQKLWAPWRQAYFTDTPQKGCLFCRFWKEKSNDVRNYVLERTAHSYSVLNLYPYNNGHLLIIPRKHAQDLSQLNDAERLDLVNLFVRTKKAVASFLKPDGFNAGINFGKAAGAGIENHIHLHLVPRWVGDTNFMPVTGDTKVVSESLRSFHARMMQTLKRMKKKT